MNKFEKEEPCGLQLTVLLFETIYVAFPVLSGEGFFFCSLDTEVILVIYFWLMECDECSKFYICTGALHVIDSSQASAMALSSFLIRVTHLSGAVLDHRKC